MPPGKQGKAKRAASTKRPTKKTAKPAARTKRRTATKPAARPPAAAPGDALAEHNRLRALMGLAPVAAPLVADPELDEAAKLRRLGGTKRYIIDAMYAGEGPTPPTGTIVHWWGQFSAELPAPFTLPHGGHGYAEARDLEHATRVFATLRDAVLAMKTPSTNNMKLTATREWAGVSPAGQGWYRWMLPDERQMTVVFTSRAKLTKAERRSRIRKLA